MIDIVVQGVALASIWFWVYSLFKCEERSIKTLVWWIKVIVPQGVVIALALNLIGAL